MALPDGRSQLGLTGLALGLPGQIKLTIETGLQIAAICKSYASANEDVGKTWVRLDMRLAQMKLDMHFLESAADQLEPDIQQRLNDILRMLRRSLQDAANTFNGALDANKNIDRNKWVLLAKPRLASLAVEIDAWQDDLIRYVQLLRFTGSGFSKTKLENRPQKEPIDSPVDRLSNRIVLARIAELPDDAIPEINPLITNEGTNLQYLNHTSLRTVLTQDSTSAGLLVECRQYSEDAGEDTAKALVSHIARILAAAGSEAEKTHVLQAVAYASLASPAREIQLILKYPPSLDSPISLRELLLTHSHMPSINARLDLCRQAATAAFITHTSGLVHESICPETFLIFQQKSSSTDADAADDEDDSLGTLFLTGFELARQDTPDAISSRRGAADWQAAMYAHPSRHVPGTPYTMAHDIYALGVNLLEIALWTSLVTWNEETRDLVFADDAIPGGGAACVDIGLGVPGAGERLRQLFLNAAVTTLPVLVGRKFRDVVVFCLEMLDEGTVKESGRRDGKKEVKALGLEYIDSVLAKLDEIRV